MPAPNYTFMDYARQMRAMLPRGRLFQRDDDTVQFSLMLALSHTWDRFTARSNNLLVDAFPATTLELLPEWEATLGLPDPCAGPSPTVEARRAQVVARFAAEGGQSRAYYVSFAAALGYTIDIQNFAPFRAGQSRAGDPCYDQQWCYVFAVLAPLNTVQWFRAGIGAAGEPLAYWSNTVLECEINAVKPAHMLALFEYH